MPEEKILRSRMHEYLSYWFAVPAGTNNYSDLEFIKVEDLENMLTYMITGDEELVNMPEYKGGN